MTEEELSGYNEKHHILPRCMNGPDSKENIVLMPVRCHILAHMILAEVYPEIYGIRYSLRLMFNLEDSDSTTIGVRERVNAVKTHISSRTVAYYKQFSKNLSPDHVEKLKKSNRRRVKGPDGTIYKSLLEASKTVGLSVAAIESRLEDSTSGWVRLDPKKNSKSGSESPNAKKIVGPNGVIYGSMKEALMHFDKGVGALQNRLKGRVKSNEGWRYLNPDHINDTVKYKTDVNRELSSKRNAKRVKSPSGEIFDTMKEALDKYNFSRHTLIDYLKSGNKGWEWI